MVHFPLKLPGGRGVLVEDVPVDQDVVTFVAASNLYEAQAAGGGGDQDVQVRENSVNVGSPRRLNFADPNDFVISEDIGNDEIDVTINRNSSNGICGLDATGRITKAEQHIDTLYNDLTFKQSVRIATEVNDSLSGLADRDGVTPVANDRILVKAQTAGEDNGIYLAAAGAWSRALDYDNDAKATSGSLIVIQEGTANADQIFQLTTNEPITLGTTSLTFTIFSGAGEANLIASLGSGTSLLTAGVTKSGVTLQIKSLSVTAPINKTDSADLITITLDALVSADLAAAAGILLTQLQDISTDRILGRETAASGAIEELTLNATLELISGAIRRAAITGDVSVPAGSNTSTITGLLLSKLQDIATDRILGRETAASGVIEELILNTTLELVSGAIRRAAITGDVSVPAGSNTSTITGLLLSKLENSTDSFFVRGTGSSGCVGEAITITKGGTILDPAGAINILTWRAPFPCTIINIRGNRIGGSATTINARRNGASNHLAAALNLSSVDTWQDGGAVQNTTYVAGDDLEIMIVSLGGSPTQIAIQVDFTRP